MRRGKSQNVMRRMASTQKSLVASASSAQTEKPAELNRAENGAGVPKEEEKSPAGERNQTALTQKTFSRGNLL